MLRRRSVPGVLAAALLASCRSPEPALYTILPVSGATRRGGPAAVAVREVSLARYLDRQQIVRSAESYRLEVSGNDWWGEPLDAMLTRVLVENLAQRLPASNVLASGGAVSVPGEAAMVEVNIQRLGLVRPGTLALTAQVSVRRPGPRAREQTRTEAIEVPAEGEEVRAFVAAASQAMGRLSDAVARMLAG